MKHNKLKPPTILFITQLYPFPPDMGGTFRTFGTLKALLSLGCKVHLVSFTDIGSAVGQEKISDLQIYKNLNIYKIPSKIIEDFYPYLKFWRFFKSLLLFQPYRATKYHLGRGSRTIQAVLKNDSPEIIYLDHISSAVYLPLIKKMSSSAKTVLDVHDIESQLSIEKFTHAKSVYLKMVLLLEHLKSKFFEVNTLNDVDKVFVMSQPAKDYLEPKISTPISIIPISLFEPKTTTLHRLKRKNYRSLKQLTFIGTLSLDVNKDGLRWFIEKVWPLIKIKVPEAKFVIIGSYSRDNSLKKLLSTDGVLYLGYRRDLKPIYQQATIGIVPMLVGGTVRMKTLGFLAHGVPVVSTSAGVYGIPKIKNQVHCLIADSAEEFADKTVKLLKNSHQREKLGQAAIKLMTNYYTFDNLQRFLNYELSRLRA